jgi:CBS domain-containing membrane protein
MKKRTPVSKIMTKNPISVNLSNEVADVVQIFKDHNIHHIPVVSGDKLIGMISKTDIDRISFVNSYAMEAASAMVYDILKLEQVMTANLETVQVEDQIKEAAELLARGRYHALPVMDGKKLAGIVTSTDVINYLLEQY